MKRPEDIPEVLVEKVVRARYETERERMALMDVTWPEYDSPSLRQAESNWIDGDKAEAREILALAWDDIWADGFTDGFSSKIEAEK